MGHSVQPIASTSAATCLALILTAEGRAAAAALCKVERRGGCRSICATSCFMIFLCSLAKTSKNKSCQVANGGREEKVKEEGWMGWEKTLFAGSLRKACMVRICKR
jgi:hypothetical protein